MNIQQIRQQNRRAGQHFFDPGTINFFNSRTLKRVINGNLFVTSEQHQDKDRKYTVRMILQNGSIETIGDFNSLTQKEAYELAESLPDQFRLAFELARDCYNGLKEFGKFQEQAEIEPRNNKNGEFSSESFTGACSWIALNTHKLGHSWLRSVSEVE